jgi:hypothetical protein
MMMLLKMHEVRKFRVNRADGMIDSLSNSVFAAIIFFIHRKNAANKDYIYRILTHTWQNISTDIKTGQASPGRMQLSIHYLVKCVIY